MRTFANSHILFDVLHNILTPLESGLYYALHLLSNIKRPDSGWGNVSKVPQWNENSCVHGMYILFF